MRVGTGVALFTAVVVGCGSSPPSDNGAGAAQERPRTDPAPSESGQSAGVAGDHPGGAPTPLPQGDLAGGVTVITDSHECRALLPDSIGAPRERLGPTGSNAVFGTGTSDGEGAYVGLLSGYKHFGFDFYLADGTGDAAGSMGAGAWAEQERGFQTLDIDVNAPEVDHLSVWNGKGQLLREVPVTNGLAYGLLPDPGGGSAVVTSKHDTSSPGDPERWLERFDAEGRSTGTVSMEPYSSLVAVATSGEALVLGAYGGRARWYDRRARPITDWYSVPFGHLGWFSPLADGSVAAAEWTPGPGRPLVNGNGFAWKAVFPPGKARVEAAPAWLAAEDHHAAWIVRGGRAMAFASLPPRGGGAGLESGCVAECGTIDIVTRRGVRCGTISLPGGSDETVNIGKDGTVFAVKTPPGAAVRWRWWPKLLQ